MTLTFRTLLFQLAFLASLPLVAGVEDKASADNTLIIQILPYSPAWQEILPPTDHFLKNETTILMMGKMFRRVAAMDHWQGMGLTAKEMKNAVSSNPLGETDLIQLRADLDQTTASPQLLTDLVQAYVATREELKKDLFRQTKNQMDDELLRQSDLVADLRKGVTVALQQWLPLSTILVEEQIISLQRQLDELRLKKIACQTKRGSLAEGESDKELDQEIKVLSVMMTEVEKSIKAAKDTLIDEGLKEDLISKARQDLEKEEALLHEMKLEHHKILSSLAKPTPAVLLH